MKARMIDLINAASCSDGIFTVQLLDPVEDCFNPP